jgi:hypothetical protein
MKIKRSYIILIIVFVSFASSCKNKAEQNTIESTIIEEIEDIEAVNYSDNGIVEQFYVFSGAITDSMINKIQNLGDPFITYQAVDKIYTSGKELSAENEYEKIFFRKTVDYSVINMCVLYPDPYNDFIYDASWFVLGGGEKIISVFQYEYIAKPILRNDNLLVIISQDSDGNFFTDIFIEDYGMRYCSLARFCEQDEEYIEYFSDVKSVGDFKKKFPEYVKISMLKQVIISMF